MKITAGLIIGSIIALAFGGLGAFVIYISGIVLFQVYMAKRGLLFIQSYVYLATLKDTDDLIKANWLANDLTPSRARAYLQLALDFADHHCNGMQLPVIAKAKEYGFVYKGQPIGELLKWVWS